MVLKDALFGRKVPTSEFVAALMREPPPSDVSWLAELLENGDVDRARWELRYASRALGLLVAQRDALNDGIASAVARELAEAMRQDRNVAAPLIRLAERQFNERLGAYREMWAYRGRGDELTERLGRTLLLLAGSQRMSASDVAEAAKVVTEAISRAGAALRQAFGPADLRALDAGGG